MTKSCVAGLSIAALFVLLPGASVQSQSDSAKAAEAKARAAHLEFFRLMGLDSTGKRIGPAPVPHPTLSQAQLDSAQRADYAKAMAAAAAEDKKRAIAAQVVYDSLRRADAKRGDAEARRREVERKRSREAAAARAQRIAAIPLEYREYVRKRRVIVGMQASYARIAWGPPQKINITQSRYGRHEQWVYGIGHYLYVEDGVVTAIQTSR